MDIEKLLKENGIDMSVKEFTGYTSKANKMYKALDNTERFIKSITEVAIDEDNSLI